MAKLRFLLQGTQSESHAAEVRRVLDIEGRVDALISVAFVRQAGVAAISATLKAAKTRIRCFIGIRNDITSIQAVWSLLATGVEVFAVDTASRHRLYHPKLYLATNKTDARAVIGSANLTFSGLHNNIEASSVVDMKLTDHNDQLFVTTAFAAFNSLLTEHPKHVFRIQDRLHAERLFVEGRLANESIMMRPATIARCMPGVTTDDLPPIALPLIKPMALARIPLASQEAPAFDQVGFKLVWKSKPLERRNVQVPTGQKTSKTGDIGLGKGAFTEIDQLTYFRLDVFGDLDWVISKVDTPNLERTHAEFKLIVKNINCDVHTLEITHDANPASNQIKRNNHITRIKWGTATSFISREDLLGRIFYLYREIGTSPPRFLIEID